MIVSRHHWMSRVTSLEYSCPRPLPARLFLHYFVAMNTRVHNVGMHRYKRQIYRDRQLRDSDASIMQRRTQVNVLACVPHKTSTFILNFALPCIYAYLQVFINVIEQHFRLKQWTWRRTHETQLGKCRSSIWRIPTPSFFAYR